MQREDKENRKKLLDRYSTMEHARKMVLVPQELAHQVQTNHYHAQAPTYQGLNGLDEEMQTILRRTDIPKDERVKLYQQALVNYINLNQRLNQPISVKVESETTTEEKNPTTMSWSSRVLDNVPKTLKKKAEQLMIFIEQAPNNVLHFNKQGELVVNEKTVEGTHIVDLINDTLRSRKNLKPKGWEEFTNALAHIHPPQELIGNDDRWHHIEGRRQTLLSTKEYRHDTPSSDEQNEDKNMYATASHLPGRKTQRTRKTKKNPWEPY